MLKTLKKLTVVLLLLCFLLAFTGCGEKSDTVTITFKQDGMFDVVREIEKGDSLLFPPSPKSEDGYDIVWDRTEFIAVQEDITVNAIKTPKQYKITYDLGSRKGDDFVNIEGYEQNVTFNQTVTTYKPTCSGYTFIGWEIQGKNKTFTDGKYTYPEDITLIARWQLSDNDDDRFSPTIPST